jgi:tetratricopeptide (TPR) repeat protein
MKRFLPLALLLLALLPVRATPGIDSLSAALSRHPAADSVRVDLLNQLGYQYWIVNPAKSELLGKEAIALADSLGYLRGLAFAKRVVGVSYWARGQHADAMKHLVNALITYQHLGDHEGLGWVYNNLGLVYQDQQNYPAALGCFDKAARHFVTTGDALYQLRVLANTGDTYLRMGNLRKAETIFSETLRRSQALGRAYDIAEAFSSLGMLASAKKDPAAALQYFRQSVQTRSALEDHEGLAKCYYLMGKIYLEQNKYDLAERHLLRGRGAALKVHSLKWLTAALETLKNLEVTRGNYAGAVAYFEAYSASKDSLFNKEKLLQITHLQTQFETLQKGREALHAQQALAEARLENARLQEIELTQELELKNKKLTSYSINFIQKNELMEELKSNIKQLKKSPDQHTTGQLNGLHRLVEQSGQIDRDWEEFKLNFEQVHKDFYKVLKAHHPELTAHELKLCTLLKLNMNLKEAANLMGISPESVKKARHRLRKKFNLSREENLVDYIILLESQAPPSIRVA